MDEVRLYEMYLNEAIEERRTDLINRNEDYKNLREKFNYIMNKYPNLQFILEDREMILDETECRMLQKLAKIYMEICDFEEKEIFLLGGKEMYFYLKDNRHILSFYRFLENKNIYCHANTFRNALYNAFKQTEYMRQVEHIKRLKQVIKAYEEWVNDNR